MGKKLNKLLLLPLFLSGSLYAENIAMLKEGKQVFDKWCIHCHGVNMPATAALKIFYKDTGISPLVEERKNLDESFVKFVVRKGRYSMPFFRKTEINEEQLNSLAAYLARNK